MELETYSHNDGRKLLEQKGVLDDIHKIPSIWTEHGGQHDYTERSNALNELGGWKTEVQIDLGPEDRTHDKRLTPFLDVYHPEYHVAIEHEKKEHMRARWHLMKTQAAHERDQALDIDVTVLIFRKDKNPSLQRLRRELNGPFFTEHFPIHLPVYTVEYTPE